MLNTPSSNSINFENLSQISEGSYGKVYKASDPSTSTEFAIKKLKLIPDPPLKSNINGLPLPFLREINLLSSLNHPNLINFINIVQGKTLNDLYLIMPFIDYELKSLISIHRHVFSLKNIKSIIYQILKGICYLHENYIFHRDLKTSNILLDRTGLIKIIDFGLSRKFSFDENKDKNFQYTPNTVTLWYRAPEILLKMNYNNKIDIWSIGCVMGELLLNRVLFQGENEIDQLNKIFYITGNINENEWNYKQNCGNNYINMKFNEHNENFKIFKNLSEKGKDLLKKLLTLNPNNRISAKEALNHEWFKEGISDLHELNKLNMSQINNKYSIYSIKSYN